MEPSAGSDPAPRFGKGTTMLICKFASPRSQPERIRDWLAYLEQLAGRHEDDGDALRTLRDLRSQAEGWLLRPPGADRGESRAG
jgi:hypothetical protein